MLCNVEKIFSIFRFMLLVIFVVMALIFLKNYALKFIVIIGQMYVFM